MPLHHALAGQHSNVMSGLERHRGIDFEMCIDHDHFAHFASADVVHGRDARRHDQRSPDCLDLLFVNGPVHQIMHRIPCKAPPHIGNHEADDERYDWVDARWFTW